ncbi:MAG: type II secretion system F family protein [Chloroflexi bacterium]|nr:type II secretion system F family protein [Chloroflexota bacterium]
MPFKYIAYTADNQMVQGVLDAYAEKAAEESLDKAGFRVISLKEVKRPPTIEELFPSLFNIKGQDIITFSRQLATLFEAGLAILPALQVLEDQITNKPFKKIITQLIQDLQSGSSFSAAIDKHPSVFPEMFRRMLHIGERTGDSALVLRQVADYLERQSAATKKAAKALMIPVITLFLAFGVVALLITVALPPMIEMFGSLDIDLPLPTRMLMGLVAFTETFRVQILLTLVIGGGVAYFYIKSPQGEKTFQRFLLKTPILGRTIVVGEIARFSRTMSVLLSAQISLPEIIGVAYQSTKNVLMHEGLADVQRGLMQGQGLSVPLSASPIFPKMLVQMIKVGEETGTLDTTLATLAQFYDRELEDRTDSITGMIEPVMTIGIALVVGFIALSVIMPMYSIVGAFG